MTSPSVETFIGPCVVIIWLSFVLYGLVLAQVYFYLTTYHDHVIVRTLVVGLCVLETSHMAICGHWLYTYLVIDFANPEKVLSVVWSTAVAVYLELTVSGIVQSYYIYRIWRLSNNIPVSLYVTVALCIRLAIGFRATTFSVGHETWESMASIALFQRLVNTSLSLSALVDSSIALILTFYLHRSHALARTKTTKNTVHKLMYYGLGAGAVSMMTSITTVIIVSLQYTGAPIPTEISSCNIQFNVFTSELHYVGLLMVLAKVYANSMLAMLNIRQGIKRGTALKEGFSIELSTLPTGDKAASGSSGETTKICVDRKTVVTRDYWVDAAAEATKKKGEGEVSSLQLA